MQTLHTICSRADAKAEGRKTYFNGKPCKYGHTALRYVAGGSCVICAADRQKQRPTPARTDAQKDAYNKKWNASTKGYAAKMRWKERDPVNAWACSAVGGAKARAARKGLPFDLDKEYVRSLCTDKCPVLNTPFVWYGEKLRPDSPSLDRINPAAGYVRGNVAVISQRANAIKSNASFSEIQAVADWLRTQT